MAKLKDLVVKNGSYIDANGEKKYRWLNIGALMSGDNGQYIILNKTFNPAGVVDERGGQSIIISLFDSQNRNNNQPAGTAGTQQQASGQPQQDTNSQGNYDDDIPF